MSYSIILFMDLFLLLFFTQTLQVFDHFSKL